MNCFRSIDGRNGRVRRLGFLCLSIALGFLSPQAVRAQQTAPVERVYQHSQVDVETALQNLQAYATNRLPALDGFVKADASTLDHFDNPHYQYRIEIFMQGATQVLVQVTAKITAWYGDSDPAHSQYVLIPSNGRLEQDLLDRLSVYLEKGSTLASTGLAPPSGSGTAAGPPGDPLASGAVMVGGGASGFSGNATGVTAADPANIAAQVAAVRSAREAAELNQRKLQQQISELEANARTQRYLSNLAVVHSPATPIFEQADETSKILFRADPEDEFEIIQARERWVQVRLENSGEAWVRASQLQPNSEVDDAEDVGAANFTTPNEEVKAFAGDWAPLKGKPALFVFAQPARSIPENMLGKSQFDFSKHIFTQGYREAAHSEQNFAGVVVVFLGAKGGVASATLEDIRRWRDGLLPDKQFFSRCSFDPPESFGDATKK
ncbi:MAG: hypothetical protein WB780_08590 [Candidatus Acidiferrales bacterium]